MDNSSVKSLLRSPALITIVSLTVVYILAYAIDTAIYQLKNYAGATFNSRPAVLLAAMAPAVVVIGIFSLTWLTLRYLPPSRFVGIALLVSGWFVGSVYLSFLVGFPVWLRTTIIGRFRYALMNFGLQSSIYYVASACSVIGIAALGRYLVNRRASAQEN